MTLKNVNKKIMSRASPWVLVLFCIATLGTVTAWQVNVLRNETDQCVPVNLIFTGDEFIREFHKIFVMSDGSLLAATATRSGNDMVDYMESLMAGLGITAKMHTDAAKFSVSVCHSELMRIYMMATLGNLLNVPQSTQVSTVVVDSFTGKMTIVPPYEALRVSFLETMLVLSIIAIVRLSLIRKINS